MLSLFVLIYWSNLFPLDSVSNLIAEGMIEDPEDITNPRVRFFLDFHRQILGSLILVPICLFALVKTYNTLKKPAAKQSGDALTEPLLPFKENESASTYQICPEQVVPLITRSKFRSVVREETKENW